MSGRKAFRSARAAAQQEPLVFEVGTEEFSVPLPLPGIVLLDLAAASEDEGAGAAAACTVFLRDVLGKDNWQRFRDATTAERLDIEDVMEVVQWIVEESTGKATQRPSTLPSMPSSSTTSSLDAATSVA